MRCWSIAESAPSASCLDFRKSCPESMSLLPPARPQELTARAAPVSARPLKRAFTRTARSVAECRISAEIQGKDRTPGSVALAHRPLRAAPLAVRPEGAAQVAEQEV